MLFVRDKGRMCNNLLQYGHVYAWAREHGRHTVSMRFAYKYPYFHIGHTRWHNFAVYALAKGAARVGLLPTASFDSPDGNPEAQRLMDTHRWLMVEGWYVRYYDLFLKYKQDIRSLFAFCPKVSRATDSYIARTDGSQGLRLGVHIRRGDYRTWMNGRYYYDDPVYIDYIRRFVASQSQPVHIYICGNDPSLNRALYEQELPGVALSFATGTPGEDLCLLSRCQYIIGAPSTFSLVASMYHDSRLCWMMAPLADGEAPQFDQFDQLFRHII